MNKQELLDNLKTKMEVDNTLPLKKEATRLVFGVGNPEAEIVCVGEGPGFFEDQKGEPFVGNAGKLLNKLLLLIKLPRENVYITNVVHHRPPQNRDPLPEEILAYGKYLDEMINIIEPIVIITLGRFSMAKFLPNTFISSVHGRKFEVKWGNRNISVVPMYHPAAALRNGNIMNEIKNDFLKLADYLKEIQEKKEEIVIEQNKLF
jgi:DNA polymerase